MILLFWRRPPFEDQTIIDSNMLTDELSADRPIPPLNPDTSSQPRYLLSTPIPPLNPDPDSVPPQGERLAGVSILKRARSKAGSRAELVSPASVGESQLAIECCCQADEIPMRSLVLWIGAEARGAFLGDLKSIADLLELGDARTTEAELPQIIAQWLNDPSNGPWLLVPDGVTEAGVLDCGKADITASGTESDPWRGSLVRLLSNVSHSSTRNTPEYPAFDAAAPTVNGNSKDVLRPDDKGIPVRWPGSLIPAR
ncbi:uncharacterized protein B0I36DRAFT_356383 [Microdochium trichocladiopsis]|uniref:Uncharacterized protein n=1 Tax=Microdochium trichocladiopsis TaxID=1682393 RepID=A0A9P9BI79_9PEZI|nr:uncharacterized protein B0I36DRAFT_356383 [Microdochium trichocladiopsis]KAH7010758.1 hypothetical protein B0I36DRAFT_356383 [Microdochium trichocladiopsis]